MTNRFSSQKNTFLLMGVLISIITITYQNCGRMNNSGPYPVDPSTQQKPAITELRNADSITLLKSSTDGFGMYAYQINIATGEVEKRIYDVPKDDPSNQPVHLCLNETKRLALENEIDASSICYFRHIDNPNLNCTMEYRYPYAIASHGPVNIKLGENASPCVDFYDICVNNRDNFISTIDSILVDIDSSVCQ